MKKIKAAFTLCAAVLLFASCGSIFPDKLWYPVEQGSPPPKKEQKADTAQPAPTAEKPPQAARAEGRDAPMEEEGDAVIFGEAPQANNASPGAAPVSTPAPSGTAARTSGDKVSAPEKPERLANPLAMILPAPDQKTVPPPPVEARESSLGVNALARSFAMPFDQAWEKTIEVMLAAPLAVVDKSSGIIITEWMVQQRAGGGIGAGLFGDGQRTIRYKYSVKLYDHGGDTEVVVIPYTQYTEGRQWLDGKPRLMVPEHLMRLLVAKMEAR